MKKRGSVLFWIGIVFLVIVLILLGVGFYFYNYYVFETFRVCVGDGVDSEIPCVKTSDCSDIIKEQGIDLTAELGGAPDFFREKFQKIFNEVVYCNESCFVKKVRGIDFETREWTGLESCDEGEKEFVVEIRGKEGLEILRWLKNR